MWKIFSVIVALILAACTKEETSIAKIEEVKNPYAVTPDEAVQLLKTVIGGETTRAVSIGDIKTLRKSDFVPTTRGGEDGDLIYIVDLENGGSAVMGADKRMEPIYAILDETKISPEKLTQVATRGDDSEQDIEEYVMGLVNNKIQVDVMGFEHTLPEMPMIPRDQTWTETTVIGRQSPLLRTKWGQSDPFNNYFPLLDGETVTREYAGCVTVAVAQIIYHNRFPNHIGSRYFSWENISQYEFDDSSPSNDVENAVAWLMWAIALDLPADWGNTDTRDDGTASCIEDAASLLVRAGYNNVQVDAGISLVDIIDMLCDKNLPVYLRGECNDYYGNRLAHAWVVDGCNIYKEDFWVRHYINEFRYNDYIENTREYNLLHCNFGYEGRCDGYYSSGLFDLYGLSSEYIDTSVGDEWGSMSNRNYIYNFKMMTYNLN